MKWKATLIGALLLSLILGSISVAQAQTGPIDFSGTWMDPFSETGWRYRFVVVENDLVIRQFVPGSPEGIFGWGKLSGRNFTGYMNTEKSTTGIRRFAGKFEGRISDDNKTIYMTWPQRDGPYQGRYIRE
jgi:hypothetical protein